MHRLRQTIARLLSAGWEVVANRREKVSCQEFAQILAQYVLRSVVENKNGPPNTELRRFAKSVRPDAPSDVIDSEILFLLGFLLSQICALQIEEKDYLDELIPGFYAALASNAGANPLAFEDLARSRYENYGEPYARDMKRMQSQHSGVILWKFILDQLGKNLRSNFDFERDTSDFIPASLTLGIYFTENMKFVRKIINDLDRRTGKS